MPEEEINLIEYIEVLLKRKNMILTIAISTMAIAIIFTIFFFYFQYVYQINTILEVGHMEEFVPEAPNQLAQKIRNDNYGEAIRAKLEISQVEYPDMRSWEISSPQGTRLLILTIKTGNSEKARAILAELNRLIIEEHQEKFGLQKNILLDSKKRIENKINNLQEEEKILQEKVEYLVNLQSKEPMPVNQFLLTEARRELETKKKDIEDQYLNLNSLLRRLEDYEPTHVVKQAIIPEKLPLTINKIVTNLIIGLVLGIFIGTLSAFFQEFWQKSKPR